MTCQLPGHTMHPTTAADELGRLAAIPTPRETNPMAKPRPLRQAFSGVESAHKE